MLHQQSLEPLVIQTFLCVEGFTRFVSALPYAKRHTTFSVESVYNTNGRKHAFIPWILVQPI